MALSNQTIKDKLQSKFSQAIIDCVEEDIYSVFVNSSALKEIIYFLKKDDVLRFNFLTDLCCVQYPHNEEDKKFVMVYHLHNWIDNKRLRIKTYLSENDLSINSITSIFLAANWMERETFDFFGVNFIGHPNLKRIMNDNGMKVFPMRKEYPLEDSQRTDKDDRFFGRVRNNDQLRDKE